MAHSLGSAIIHSTYSSELYQPTIRAIRHLFLVGSPLGLFLAQVDIQNDSVLPPKEFVYRLYNIYNIVDPVASRIGTLLSEAHFA